MNDAKRQAIKTLLVRGRPDLANATAYSSEAAGPMTGGQFYDAVRAAYMQRFPRGSCNGGITQSLGTTYLAFTTRLQGDASKLPSGIADNDAAYQKFFIDHPGRRPADGTVIAQDQPLPPKLTAEIIVGGGLMVTPSSPRSGAYDLVKFGWRKKAGTPEQVLKHMTNYFAKMHRVVEQNRDRLDERTAVP